MKRIRKISRSIPQAAVKKKVAAYARVSRESDEMQHSLVAQIDYYSKLIEANPEWEMVKVYADYGISGTGTAKREQFNEMLNAARAGQIDIILTKSIQRFARNTVDLLNTVRELEELGVEVRFEREHINSLSSEGELMLTLLASFAQEESRSISENVKWGIQKRFQQGIPHNRGRLYGYTWQDGIPVVVEEEAKVIRQIYQNFFAGKSRVQTAKELNAAGITTWQGNEWDEMAIRDVLTKPIYSGVLLLQRTFTENHITHRKMRNKGELPQYLVQENHEAIVTPEEFEAVQAEMARRREEGVFCKNPHDFTCKIHCSNCGCRYIYIKERNTWMCNSYGVNGTPCHAPSIPDEEVRRICNEAMGIEEFDIDLFKEKVNQIIIYPDFKADVVMTDGQSKSFIWRQRPKKWTEEQRRKCLSSRQAYLRKGEGRFSEFTTRLFGLVSGKKAKRQTKFRKHEGKMIIWNIDNAGIRETKLKQIVQEILGLEEYDKQAVIDQVDRIAFSKTEIHVQLNDGGVNMPRVVTTIPATKPQTGPTPAILDKRRVAAYARVSTDSEEQQTSYYAQIKYYKELIQNKPEWEFVDVYTDEGITGTSTKHREGFKKMVADALAGKIDLIITKSVSRFARNTVDSLSTIRKLKSAGVEVYFEKENIYTFDGKGEVLLTIMASLAQEESRSISENTTWGQRKRFADGKASVAFSNFLGYDRGPNGEFIVNPDQAKVVKEIYALFLEGKSYGGICRDMEIRGYRTPAGKSKWRVATVQSILTNEKYKGDALLQKTYIEDFLTKKMKKNNGEIPQYYVEKNHEAIIDPLVFEQVQQEVQRRRDERIRGPQKPFSNKFKCADCGHWYGSKLWHSTDKYKKTVWQCNNKYRAEKRCQTPALGQSQIEDAFVKAVNQLIQKKDERFSTLKTIMATVLDTEELERQSETVEDELLKLEDAIHQLIENRGEDFLTKYQEMEEKYKAQQEKCCELQSTIQDKKSRKAEIIGFLETLKDQEILDEFDEKLFLGTVDYGMIDKEKNICFKFKDGTEITIAA